MKKLIAICFSFVSIHASPYFFLVDGSMSPYAGGQNLISSHKLIEKSSRFIAGKSDLSTYKIDDHWFGRACEMTFIWMPENIATVVVQHEVFGHGYRIRDSKDRAKVHKYHIDLPPPYGEGGGYTSFYYHKDISYDEQIAISMGGVEATAILASMLERKWLDEGRIDPKEAFTYNMSFHDIDSYILTTEYLEPSDGHDIYGYISLLEKRYPNQTVTAKELRNNTWLNFFHPFSYAAALSWWNYIINGSTQGSLPVITIKNVAFTLGPRMALSPFGIERYVELLLGVNNRFFKAYVRGGENADLQYYGLGLHTPKFELFSEAYVSFLFDGWYQPKLFQNNSTEIKQRIGASLITSFVFKNEKYFFQSDAGFKSRGFVQGLPLQAAPIVRLGFGMLL